MISKDSLIVLASVSGVVVAAILVYDHFIKKVPVGDTAYIPPVVRTSENNSGTGFWDGLNGALGQVPTIINAF